MKINVEIDKGSGFCNGVIRAVEQAENYLNYSHKLYSLGDIVHNTMELKRLSEKGLVILDKEDIANLKDSVLLIRAHGEPPETYALAHRNNLQIIDCTCPVVLRLQDKIKQTWMEIEPAGGQIVIFGKRGHAEVNGLVGQTEGEAIVVENVHELSKIDFSRPIALFSQTTKDPIEFQEVANCISEKGKDVKVFNTVCRQVASRHKTLVQFAKDHSVILFVSGEASSNGKVLFDLCRSVNARSYTIERMEQIDLRWFKDGDNVGICGATSTPTWQLEQTKTKLYSLLH
ncbi:MAG: 4-hydroxy-3-methylbut-2-enyl diphosphate reductase [Bacteroidales bacterium]|nr:4-hydroxy-3-methylbut-2-enyl diphosphate reductase [Bacteroidales bacterium]MDD3201141.1 4-hydroxy-3-methylbut-2-enyl diphosphate reductase [Bacteroidales bacterium]